MKVYGHVNMQSNELQQMAIGVETNFPASPEPGRVVFKDKRLFICTEIAAGIPAWIPLTAEINTYEHIESSVSLQWTVTHNLDTVTPLVQVYNQSDNTMVFPDDIEVVDNNTVIITFGTGVVGRAIVMAGAGVGTDKPPRTYEYTQTTLSDTWTVTHNLGYTPVVRVFVGGSEIIPSGIEHVDNFTSIITFTSQQVGYAKFA